VLPTRRTVFDVNSTWTRCPFLDEQHQNGRFHADTKDFALIATCGGVSKFGKCVMYGAKNVLTMSDREVILVIQLGFKVNIFFINLSPIHEGSLA
jgi:hypothetical protein